MMHVKTAITQYPVLDIIKNRWSPRSFSGKAISTDDLNTIVEAASWSFSAMNEQPWRYIVAEKGTALFDTFHQALYPGNQPWNTKAAAFILSLQKTTFTSTGNINNNALHDIGAANILLTLQANSMGIYTHVMEGYSREALSAILQLEDGLKPVVLISLGYPDMAEKLEEPFKTRELTPRLRKGLNEIILTPQIN